jgi:putative hydrolase of the HAD superfamily
VPGVVLFDLDGTLVDHEAASRKAVVDWARSLDSNLDVDDDALCGEWLRLEGEHFSGYLTGALSFAEQRRQRVTGYLSYLGLSPTPDAEVDAHFNEYLRRYEGAWTAHPDARPCLDRLIAAGVVTGVLTNGDEEQQQAKLRAVGLSDCFTVVVASSTLPQPKPAVEAFQSACERLGREPRDVSYVGDNLQTDATAAQAAGLRGVWLDRHAVGTARIGVRTVRTLHEFADVFLSAG